MRLPDPTGPPKKADWARGPLALIVSLAVLAALFFLVYGIVLAF
ncbi:hypothetical protein ABZY68_36795 [Streptomyces sp. NPDC006482]